MDTLRLELLPDVATLLKLKRDRDAQVRLAKRVIGNLRTIYLYSRIWLDRLIERRIDKAWEGYFLPKENHKKLHLIIDSLSIDESFKPHPKLLSNLIHSHYPERADDRVYKSVKRVFENRFSFSIIETLSEAKLLGYVAPPLKKVIDLPQFDGYHRYSVDKHSIETLKALEGIDDNF